VRALKLTVCIFLVLIPQLACFLPAEDMTLSERECCKHMAGDCNESNMQGHSCCASTVRPDVAIATPTQSRYAPQSELAVVAYVSEATGFFKLVPGAATLTQQGIHSPPDDPIGPSSPVLRI